MESKQQIAPPSVNKDAMANVFDKMYITNVEKRLRDLNNPSDNDRRRWIWELIQNAKDTIANDKERNEIDVRIEIDNDIVRFSHNGAPFTAESRLGLLYKYSEEKENQESTGRFGTGFLTTHCLSKIVTIESNMYKNSEHTELCGFEVTMFRDGLIASELLEGLEKMRQSEKFYDKTFDWTTFIYHVNSDSGRKAIELGVQEFLKNIAPTMLFCKELTSIELNNNGKKISIQRCGEQILTENLSQVEFNISGIDSPHKRFIISHFESPNEEISNRYKSKRNLRLDVAIEIDDNNNIVSHEDNLSHFCVLPLVGIEEQLSEPIIINSPDFEPDSERQSLLLSGNNYNEEACTITETGINRLIYSKVFPLFETLVLYLSNHHYGRLYLLSNGLNRVNNHKNLDSEWYKENVRNNYRKILCKYPLVKLHTNVSQYALLSDCIFAKEKDEIEQTLFSLIQSLYPSQMAADNHEWSSRLWSKDIALWNTEELCVDIGQKGNIETLQVTNTSTYEWYNNFLELVIKSNESLLKEHSLLPNMNGDLLKRDTEDFKEGENITSDIINLLNDLGIDKKLLLLHPQITSIHLDSKYNSQSYSAEINRLVKIIIDDGHTNNKLERLIPLLSIVPNDTNKYEINFINRRRDYFDICKTLFENNEMTRNIDNHILDSAWKECDIWFKSFALKTIQERENLQNLPNGIDARRLNEILIQLSPSIEQLNEYKVLPNQNDTFCKQVDLFLDYGIPEVLKDDIFAKIDISYKDILLHKDIDASKFAVNQKKDISTFAHELKEKMSYQNSYRQGLEYKDGHYQYNQELLNKIALYMISLLPSNRESSIYKDQNDIYNVTKELLGYDGFTSQGSVEYENKDLWQLSNKFASNKIANEIKTKGSLENLSNHLSKGETDIFHLLNTYYEFLYKHNIIDSLYEIFPNQNGTFKRQNELKKEDGKIDDTLKDIIALLVNSENEYRNVLMDCRCHSFIQPQVSLTVKDSYGLIDDKIFEYYQIPAKWNDENYINAVHKLIEEWKDKSNNQFNVANFPKIQPNEDSIVLNVVWKKDKREQLMKLSSRLSDEQLKALSEYPQIDELANRLNALESENKQLQEQLTELGITPEFYGKGQPTEQQIADNREAKELVLKRLNDEGYEVPNVDNTDYSVILGVKKGEVSYPLVVKSCKSYEHRVWINPNEWEQLLKPNSMLWMHFGNGFIAPIKAFELLTYYDKLTLSFDTINLLNDERVSKILGIMHFFNKIHLNLSILDPNKHRTDSFSDYCFNSNNPDNSSLESSPI